MPVGKCIFFHYNNTPMPYTDNFKGCKRTIQLKMIAFFLVFAQNIDCEAVLMSTNNLCFRAKIRKNCIPLYTPGLFEPRREKTGFLHMRKQRGRSASR